MGKLTKPKVLPGGDKYHSMAIMPKEYLEPMMEAVRDDIEAIVKQTKLEEDLKWIFEQISSFTPAQAEMFDKAMKENFKELGPALKTLEEYEKERKDTTTGDLQ